MKTPNTLLAYQDLANQHLLILNPYCPRWVCSRQLLFVSCLQSIGFWVQDCDVIHLMDDGKVVDSGAYDDLLDRNPEITGYSSQ